jgi:hypothetical protein
MPTSATLKGCGALRPPWAPTVLLPNGARLRFLFAHVFFRSTIPVFFAPVSAHAHGPLAAPFLACTTGH